MVRSALLTGVLLLLASCGALTSPVVVEETTAVGEVVILTMDANTIRAANATGYEPRTLPAIFSRTAGVAGVGVGVGALPPGAYDPEDRPEALTTRLPPAYAPGPYRLGVGDVLLLATPSGIGTMEQLSGLLAAQHQRQGYTVQDSGAISIPDVGRVQVAGLTLDDAESAVFNALVAQQIEPAFSLEVAEFKSQRASIGGAVRNPMVLPLTLSPLTLAEAVAAAGGMTAPERDYASIRLYRDGELYQIPVERYLGSADLQKIALKAGDAVFIDIEYDLASAEGYFAQQIELSKLRQSARTSAMEQLATEVELRRQELEEGRANFNAQVALDAVERDYAYIAGEVGRQGRFTLPFDHKATLADALFSQAEGVPNATGNIGEVYVLRGTGDGRGIQAWHLNASNAANLVLATRFELRPNDVIFVSEKPLTGISRLLGQVALSVAAVGL
ncbi:polysaccharide biosynthesis/export family protein [Maritimibacter sp. DP1N21-5]|uniref:polysaccharide biosynthesis/export family protein n=1 Tax=Maritimibacter sp. DP1N21-5 TaxID=2836867 RepID=UPI001C493C65|nr:polysaccharide biosynthesis/export family protein [Maritimibacter sp. DP1N21-5]MBV7411063.1 polysaccharide biosynthesis/export family protein [Maritimibacter sp. DP1N21-5]